MGFMRPVIYQCSYIEIDGPMGGEIIPCDVADMDTLPEIDDRIPTPSEIALYCENTVITSIERKRGYVGRYSAPGYMDATPWIASPSESEVRAELERLYGDEEGEDA